MMWFWYKTNVCIDVFTDVLGIYQTRILQHLYAPEYTSLNIFKKTQTHL